MKPRGIAVGDPFVLKVKDQTDQHFILAAFTRRGILLHSIVAKAHPNAAPPKKLPDKPATELFHS